MTKEPHHIKRLWERFLSVHASDSKYLTHIETNFNKEFGPPAKSYHVEIKQKQIRFIFDDDQWVSNNVKLLISFFKEMERKKFTTHVILKIWFDNEVKRIYFLGMWPAGFNQLEKKHISKTFDKLEIYFKEKIKDGYCIIDLREGIVNVDSLSTNVISFDVNSPVDTDGNHVVGIVQATIKLYGHKNEKFAGVKCAGGGPTWNFSAIEFILDSHNIDNILQTIKDKYESKGFHVASLNKERLKKVSSNEP